MARYKVHAAVDPPYRRAVSGALVRRWSETVLAALSLPDGSALDIAVTDDNSVRSLNRDYRGLDEPTDVLSFPFTDQAVPAPYYGEEPEGPSSESVDPATTSGTYAIRPYGEGLEGSSPPLRGRVREGGPPTTLDFFPLPPTAGLPIGEIVISFPYAQRQATLRGHPVREEIPLLLVHGILHLLGHDHMEAEDEDRMAAKTRELLPLLT